jgi:hypothetical protein
MAGIDNKTGVCFNRSNAEIHIKYLKIQFLPHKNTCLHYKDKLVNAVYGNKRPSASKIIKNTLVHFACKM